MRFEFDETSKVVIELEAHRKSDKLAFAETSREERALDGQKRVNNELVAGSENVVKALF